LHNNQNIRTFPVNDDGENQKKCLKADF